MANKLNPALEPVSVIECPFTLENYTAPMTLVPCMHKIDQIRAEKLAVFTYSITLCC